MNGLMKIVLYNCNYVMSIIVGTVDGQSYKGRKHSHGNRADRLAEALQ